MPQLDLISHLLLERLTHFHLYKNAKMLICSLFWDALVFIVQKFHICRTTISIKISEVICSLLSSHWDWYRNDTECSVAFVNNRSSYYWFLFNTLEENNPLLDYVKHLLHNSTTVEPYRSEHKMMNRYRICKRAPRQKKFWNHCIFVWWSIFSHRTMTLKSLIISFSKPSQIHCSNVEIITTCKDFLIPRNFRHCLNLR